VNMRIKTKFPSNWSFDARWLELLKDKLRKQLPNREIWLIIEESPWADYTINTDGSRERVIFRFNIYPKTTIETIFKQDYLDGIVEHEIKHLNPNVIFHHDVIGAPQSILEKYGIDAYNRTTDLLTQTFQNYLNEVYANSDMSASGLKKYLAFEIHKLREAWSRVHGALRTVLMLVVAYIEVCYEKLGEPVPNEPVAIAASLQKYEPDVAICKQIKVAYTAMWNAVKAGQKEVDLLKET